MKPQVTLRHYEWQSHGDTNNPIIALIAPSNGHQGEEGQEKLKRRVQMLVAKGLCVKVPQYQDGRIIVETGLENRMESKKGGKTVSPAVSNECGANQIIESIEAGWNIVPVMGGDSFENKIPIILKHFEDHPDQKNSDVQIFGMSNSTYATILASHGICSFTATPFTYCMFDGSNEHAQRLEKILKGEELINYPRAILCNPDNRLSDNQTTFHYPMNIGNINSEANQKWFNIPCDQNWSISIEGFLQRLTQGNIGEDINYEEILTTFLIRNKDHLPTFIEVGNITTRYDGKRGYADLLYDDKSGEIAITDGNIDSILSTRENVKNASKEAYVSARNSVMEDLESENVKIREVMASIVEVAQAHNIPLIRNTKYGHCANMDIISGGLINLTINGLEANISKAEIHQHPDIDVTNEEEKQQSMAVDSGDAKEEN